MQRDCALGALNRLTFTRGFAMKTLSAVKAIEMAIFAPNAILASHTLSMGHVFFLKIRVLLRNCLKGLFIDLGILVTGTEKTTLVRPHLRRLRNGHLSKQWIPICWLEAKKALSIFEREIQCFLCTIISMERPIVLKFCTMEMAAASSFASEMSLET